MIIQIDNRLTLEMINIHHAEPIFHLVNSNRLHLREWLPWVVKVETVEYFKEIITISQQGYTNNSDHAFVILFDGIIVGRIGVYDIDNQNNIGAIGYWIGAEFQGKGIVSKASKVMINYCFQDLGLNRIEIKCATKNFKSQAIAERLKFTKEGIFREAELLHNEYIDIFIYSLLKKEWDII